MKTAEVQLTQTFFRDSQTAEKVAMNGRNFSSVWLDLIDDIIRHSYESYPRRQDQIHYVYFAMQTIRNNNS